ncbi:MAG: hypothetical protein AAFZ05_00775 [Pseudomonadota bacterium]
MSGTTPTDNAAPAGEADSLGLPDIGRLISELGVQMASAERKNAAALERIQGQLEALSQETRRARVRVPAEFAPAFDRLEEAIDALAEKVARAEREARKATAEASEAPVDVADDATVQTAAAEPEIEAVEAAEPITFVSPDESSPTEGEPQSAAPAAAPRAGDADPADIIDDATRGNPDEPWDTTSAEALTQIYETNAPELAPGMVAPQATPEPAAPVAPSEPSASADQKPATAEAPAGADAPARTRTVVKLMPQPDAVKAEWLEKRFAEIASQVSKTFGARDAEVSFADLARRLEDLETRFDSAFNDVATRSDVEGLRVIENYLNDITDQFERSQNELGRVSMIEREVMSLAERLSEDRLSSFVAAPPTPAPEFDLDAVAEQVAARVVDRTPAPLMPEPSEDPSETMVAVDELKRMVNSLVDQNRDGEVQTTSMMKTMEEAMIRLLDRMDGIEHAQLALVEKVQSAPAVSVASAPAATPAPAQPSTGYGANLMPDEPDDRDPAPVARAPEPPLAPAPSATPAPAPTSAAGPAPDRASPRIEPSQTGVVSKPEPRRNDGVPRVQARAAASTDLMPDPTPTDDQINEARSRREEFVAAARRAAMRASERSTGMLPDEAEVELSTEPDANEPRRRIDIASLGLGDRKRSDGAPEFEPEDETEETSQKQSSSRMRLWVAGVALAVLALGAGKVAFDQFGGETSLARHFLSPETAARERQMVGEPVKETQSGEANSVGSAAATTVPVVRQADQEPRTPDAKVVEERSTAVASADSFPLGISLDKNAPPLTAEQAQFVDERQERARHSTQVGATLPTATAVPVSLIPVDPEREVRGDNRIGAPATSTQSRALMPPALLGPLSLRTAAANGKPSAQFEVGARYAEGRGVDQDFKMAAVWYERAAKQGFPLAQYRLATLHERGLGLAKDVQLAKYWYLKAANQGTVKAMHNLAVLTAGQVGGKPDYRAAAIWFQKAAERGLADSQFNLAILYQNGLGVAKDLAKAYHWFGLAGLSGDTEAKSQQKTLGGQIARNDRIQIDGRIKIWRAKPFEANANDATVAGQLWSKAGS